MKTFLIVASVLAASLSMPTHIDYIPPEVKSTPATPNQEIYAMDIKADNIDLNTICSWQENIEAETTTLTLYTYDGNFYVLEMPTVYP